MVEISLSGSGEGSGWVTAPGYSTATFSAPPILRILTTNPRRVTRSLPGPDHPLSSRSQYLLRFRLVYNQGIFFCLYQIGPSR